MLSDNLPTTLLTAFALVLVIEGILPTLSPSHYRRALWSMIALPKSHLRLIGMSSMITGAAILLFVR